MRRVVIVCWFIIDILSRLLGPEFAGNSFKLFTIILTMHSSQNLTSPVSKFVSGRVILDWHVSNQSRSFFALCEHYGVHIISFKTYHWHKYENDKRISNATLRSCQLCSQISGNTYYLISTLVFIIIFIGHVKLLQKDWCKVLKWDCWYEPFNFKILYAFLFIFIFYLIR